jgi:N-acetylmuramoyl-L-alanine amidase
MITETDDGPVEPLRVRNRIAEVQCSQPRRKVDEVDLLIIHCTGLSYDRDHPVPDDECDPVYLTEVLRRAPGLGGIPYWGVIDRRGLLHQIVPLLTETYHALEYNRRSLGLALFGEREPATAAQYDTLVWACALLVPINGGLQIEGHSLLPRATHDAHKICPRPAIPSMVGLRADVGAAMVSGWQTWGADRAAETISDAGLVL